MQEPFVDLRERLLRAGVAPRHVRRYVKELTEHLADVIAEERRLGRNQSDAESAAFARLGGTDDLAKAMLDQPQLRSWSARAPWATLGLAPVACLAVAYFVACFILWSGWKIFLPASNSPFNAPIAGPIYGLENVYFQIGRLIYFSAPILIGWGIAIIAARQRLNLLWPTIGLAAIEILGSSARVWATRSVAGSGGHVSMNFVVAPGSGAYFGVFHFLALFVIAILPYAFWRMAKTFSPSDES